jgi:hypothetical protein
MTLWREILEMVVVLGNALHPMYCREHGNVTETSEMHMSNAQSPTESSESGRFTDVSEVHSANAYPPT